MNRTATALFDISYLDTLAYRDSVIHRLDARVKVLTTFVFVAVVASFDRYAVVALLPLFAFPVSLLSLAQLPLLMIVRRLLLVAPFAVMVGIFNPVFDQQVMGTFAGLEWSGGWLSFCSILLRFILTVGIVLILISVTSFPGICHALDRMGVPRLFIVQLLFLYRYIFVLGDEAGRLVRARDLRCYGGRGKGLRSYGVLLTQLLWRTLDRAQRVHQAMLSRGFSGQILLLHKDYMRLSDGLFLLCWCVYFVVVRLLAADFGLASWIIGLAV